MVINTSFFFERNLSSYFNEKKNHFVSDYSLISEFDIVFRLKPSNSLQNSFNKPTWLTPAQHPGVVSDPLRSKLGKYWRIDSDSKYLMKLDPMQYEKVRAARCQLHTRFLELFKGHREFKFHWFACLRCMMGCGLATPVILRLRRACQSNSL